jgi:hypothetical protein
LAHLTAFLVGHHPAGEHTSIIHTE